VDLISYLRPLRGYLVAVLLLSVLVGVGSSYLVARSAVDTYRVTLDVGLPGFNGQARELDQITADFIEGITSPEVVDAASEASGLDADVVAGALTAQRLSETGSQVRVSATGVDPERLARAVAAAAAADYQALSRPRLEAAESLEEQLREAYEDAKDTTTGRDPDQQRWQSQSEFAALRAATDARSALLDLRTRVATVEDAASPSATTVVPVEGTWPVVQTGLTNGGATLFALVALLLAFELWRTRPSRSAAAPPSPASGHPVVGPDATVPAVDAAHQARPSAPRPAGKKSRELATTTATAAPSGSPGT
jgi:hypothetical protein